MRNSCGLSIDYRVGKVLSRGPGCLARITCEIIISRAWSQRREARTTRFRRPQELRSSCALSRPPHPASCVVTIAIRPRAEPGREDNTSDSMFWKTELLLPRELDRIFATRPGGQITAASFDVYIGVESGRESCNDGSSPITRRTIPRSRSCWATTTRRQLSSRWPGRSRRCASPRCWGIRRTGINALRDEKLLIYRK
jgi:hypothetical protein